MTTLLIAIGNTLRRDDGVAHRVLELLTPLPANVTGRGVHQLTPELAEEFARFDQVVFLDALVAEGQHVRDEPTGSPPLEPITAAPDSPSGLGHTLSPAALAAVAARLFSFTGKAWLLPIPAYDFGLGEGLSPEAEAAARSAARHLREWLFRV